MATTHDRLPQRILLCLVVAVSAATTGANVITDENAKPGTPGWPLTKWSVDAYGRSAAIEGYCSELSYAAGDTLKAFVSTNPASPYTCEIYRLGYYGGAGARLITSVGPLQGSVQPEPVPPKNFLNECRWAVGFTTVVGADWVSGVYVGKLTATASGNQSYIIFVVHDNRQSDFLLKVSDFTWHAYGRWPRMSSLYCLPDQSDCGMYYGFEVAVSFDRPYGAYTNFSMLPDTAQRSVGTGCFLMFEWPMAYFMEQNGYDVSYISCIDAHRDQNRLKRTHAILSVGHDEYWTEAMYNNFIAARQSGVSIGFFSGNAAFCAISLTPSWDNRSNRVIQRQHIFSDEKELIGATSYGVGWGHFRCTSPSHWMYEGTGMQQGDSIFLLMGWEYHGAPLRANAEVFSTGVLDYSGDPVTYHATTYGSELGGTVVNASTIFWSMPLARNGMAPIPGHLNHGGTLRMRGWPQDARVQRMTVNALNHMAGVSPTPSTEPQIRSREDIRMVAPGHAAWYDLRGSVVTQRQPSAGAFVVVPPADALPAIVPSAR